MSVDSEFVRGTCMLMCPEKEILMREHERILHRLEILSGTEHQRTPKADRNKTVKSFSRSAAGQNVSQPSNLRPPKVLLETVNYLLHDVISIDYMEYHNVYDFIMDRLRAVRQDMVIQNLERPYCISILQPIVRFYAYSAYRLCEEKLSNFEPAINNKHLQECLKRLLCFYDECDELQKKYSFVSNDLNSDYMELFEERSYMESLYLIFNLGDTDALNRALGLHRRWRNDLVDYCLDISLSYRRGNWVKVCYLIKELPVLLGAVASLHLNKIRRLALQRMSYAYNSKTLTYPLEVLQEILLYNSKNDVITDLKYYNITYDNKTSTVNFLKAAFDTNKTEKSPSKNGFIDRKLERTNVTNIVLNGFS